MRLLTLNTWKCDGPYAARVAMIVREMAELRPDVVCLQESFRSVDGSFDTAARIGRELGLELRYLPERQRVRHVEGEAIGSWNGLSVLSRFGFASEEHVALPSNLADGGRSAQMVELRTPDGPIIVVNLHLTFLTDGAELRGEQLDRLRAHPRLKNPNGPVFYCGDFNATIEDDEIALHIAPQGDLVDAYSAAGGLHPRPPSLVPDMRGDRREAAERAVDHVLIMPGGANVQLRAVRHVMDTPDEGGVYPSDHAGLMVDFEIR